MDCRSPTVQRRGGQGGHCWCAMGCATGSKREFRYNGQMGVTELLADGQLCFRLLTAGALWFLLHCKVSGLAFFLCCIIFVLCFCVLES